MKKLMIIASAIVMGVTANAASVQWSLSGVTASPDTAAAAGWAVYVMDGSTYSAFTALSADKVADYITSSTPAATGATAAGRGGVISVAITGGNYAASTTVSSYMVLFNNASVDSATYYTYTGTQSVTISEGGANATMNFGTFADATSAAGGWTPTAVPEPTSGLLMLLGMAGLALRRRRS